MDFEKALFRVYDRSLESVQHDTYCFGNARPSTLLKWAQFLLLLISLLLFLLTTTLHISFVDTPGCLLQKLTTLRDNKIALNPNSSHELLDDDVILRLSISQFSDPNELFPKNAARISPKLLDSIGSNSSTDLPSEPENESSSNFEAKYEFSISAPLLLMTPELRSKLSVRDINITLDSQCFGKSSFMRGLVVMTGYDTPVINMLMFSLFSDGFLKNLKTEEEWLWEKDQLPPPIGYSWGRRLLRKPLILWWSLIAFFSLSSATALIVRVLISSGVIFMFPIFSALEHCGFRSFDRRILSLSYPWLGAPMEELRAQNKPVKFFVWGHLLKVLVYYSMYEACQLAWSEWLYNKSVPAGLQVWLFGTMMLWEYFSMLYVRSWAGSNFFPKMTLIYFVGYHFYFYNFTYGYFDLLAFVNFTLMLHVMIYTIQYLETPALVRGEVSLEHPRAAFTELPWMQPGYALPPSWTLFIPPSGRVQGIYNAPVPQLQIGNPLQDLNPQAEVIFEEEDSAEDTDNARQRAADRQETGHVMRNVHAPAAHTVTDIEQGALG